MQPHVNLNIRFRTQCPLRGKDWVTSFERKEAQEEYNQLIGELDREEAAWLFIKCKVRQLQKFLGIKR